MPADRSSKGKGKQQKEEVDPCEICGIVLSRKSDLKRHAKRHAPDDDKLPCTWEGCEFKTWQQSNLDTHIRRHTKEKIHVCRDDPECKYDSCDPAGLLRHRKSVHGYIPRSSAARKHNKKKKVASARVIRRRAEADSPGSSSANMVPSQFSFAEASSSSRPMSPPPSPTPPSPSYSSSPSLSVSPSHPPVASGSRQPPPQQYYSDLYLYSPTYSSGESEVSLVSTPVTSPPTYYESTQAEGSSSTILSMSSSSIHAGSLMNSHHSLPFAPATEDFYYRHGLLFDSSSSALLNGSSFFSSGTGTWDYLGHDQHMPMVIYDTPHEDFSPISFDDPNLWPGPQLKGKIPRSGNWP